MQADSAVDSGSALGVDPGAALQADSAVDSGSALGVGPGAAVQADSVGISRADWEASVAIALQANSGLSRDPSLPPLPCLPWDSDSDLDQELDPRPVWPGRIEVIYKAYIAEKTTWLAAHPAIRLINYRKARGLKAYPRKVIQENRKSSLILKGLPKRRLNLDTKRA